MSTSSSSRAKLAQDVLKNEQNWSEKIVSVAGMLNTKYISPWLQKGSTNTQSIVVSPAAVVVYPHVFKVHSIANWTWVLVASCDTYSIWRSHRSHKTGSYNTELIASGTETKIIDGCLWSTLFSECNFFVALDTSDGDTKSVLVKRIVVGGDRIQRSASANFPGEITSISVVNKFVILCQVGSLRLLCQDSLHVSVEVPGVAGVPTVFSAAHRWIAIQIPQSQNRVSSASDSDFGGAARKIVSGAYSLGKAGWETLGPFVHQLYKKDELQAAAHEEGPAVHGKTPSTGLSYMGGAISIIDTIVSSSLEFDIDRTSIKSPSTITLNLVCKFLAHTEDLELISFSPSGLMVASASRSGQVIHIHSLCPSGVLFSSSAKYISIKNRKGRYEQVPQLVYRLVRGLSLATVIHISFDAVESIAIVGTNNGTIHVFDLDRSNTASGLGHQNGNGLHHHHHGDNGDGINGKSGVANASSFTGSDFSSSAGSAPSSVPLSNIDELLSQFVSQQALDGGESAKEGVRRLKTLIKEVYSSRRIRLTGRDMFFVADSNRDGFGDGTARMIAPIGMPSATAATAASAVGFSVISATCAVLNGKDVTRVKPSRGEADSHELYILSSQGFLSRFRIGNPKQPAGSTSLNGNTGNRFMSSSLPLPPLGGGIASYLNGNQHSNNPKELNRWDLLSFLEEGDELSGSNSSVETPKTNGEAIHSSVGKKSAENAAWLFTFGDIRGAAGNGVSPLWTRPQVTYRSVLKQPPSAEKDQTSSKKQSQTTTSSSFMFLFPERFSSEPLGAVRHGSLATDAVTNDFSILASISSAVKSTLNSDNSNASGRLIAQKHSDYPISGGGEGSSSMNNDTIPSFEDWEVPEETEWT